MTPSTDQIIDLRSDTLTRPTARMRQAMASASVGDDTYREDPTVEALEERAADLLGKEAALFLTSGTMANLVAACVHCSRGQVVVAGEHSHLVRVEDGLTEILALPLLQFPERPGLTLAIDEIAEALGKSGTRLDLGVLSIENTHSYCGGVPVPEVEISKVAALARSHGAALHIDGARIFNAQGALGTAASDLAREADSLCFCLSKGLAAPMGSLLVGDAAFMERARTIRGRMGGGLRQAGIVAAAGLVALEEMVDRLVADHDNAAALGRGLETLGFELHTEVSTNMVYVRTPEPTRLVRRMERQGVRAMALGPERVRFVTHTDVDRCDILEVLRRAQTVAP